MIQQNQHYQKPPILHDEIMLTWKNWTRTLLTRPDLKIKKNST